jgi:hypothetical protein
VAAPIPCIISHQPYVLDLVPEHARRHGVRRFVDRDAVYISRVATATITATIAMNTTPSTSLIVHMQQTL